MKIRINSEADLENAAKIFADATVGKKHIAFHGEMGAGKTTFISALCRYYGMEEEASSPTFSIINQYETPNGKISDTNKNGAPGRIYHFDFYRIESPEETMDLGLEDYFDSGDLCLMEWPENVEQFLPEDLYEVDIVVEADGSRSLELPD